MENKENTKITNKELSHILNIYRNFKDTFVDDCVFELLKELQQYRINEQKGLIVNLPCNIGDIVYVLKSNEQGKVEILEAKIKSIIIKEDDTTYWYEYMSKYAGEWHFTNQSIGKTVFLMKENVDDYLNKCKLPS